ncbi:MAG: ABC transporter ATP-binding protein [Chloroflexi bacterium]|nr:ABC transporter ATP-binding protein [Chloroflexota bacterium]
MGSSAITLENLTRRFDDLVAVDHLTFDIGEGEVFGLLGHNGAGKTTTVRLLSGVLSPDDGSARVLGLDPQKNGADLRRRIGVLTETPSIDERLSARENLTIFADLFGIPSDDVTPRIDALLERFELLERAAEKTSEYSKGMKQRLALARTLLHEPDLIFLDEPTAGLDPIAARDVRDMIRRLSGDEGRTIVMATHNLAEAQRLCHRVAVLEHGRLLALGTLRELNERLGGALRFTLELDPTTCETAQQTLRAMDGATFELERPDTLTVTGVPRAHIPEMITALAGAGVRLYRVEPQEASLEELYFALHATEERR